MAVVEGSVAAATAVLGYDLMSVLPQGAYKRSSKPRVIKAFGLKGSAAALDTQVRLKVGQTEFGVFFNTSTGAPIRDDMFSLNVPVPSNEEITIEVTDAPLTNPINFAMEIIP